MPRFNNGYDDVVNIYTLPINLGKSAIGRGGRSAENMLDDTPFVPNETTVVIDWD